MINIVIYKKRLINLLIDLVKSGWKKIVMIRGNISIYKV